MEKRQVNQPVQEKGHRKLAMFAKAIKDFKEIIGAVILLGGLLIAGFKYYAPASMVIKLDCALESSRLLAIKRDQEISNFRNKISSQDQERLLTDILILIAEDRGDSHDLMQFKTNMRNHIKPLIMEIRKRITEIEIDGTEINKEVVELENKVSRRECPNV